MSDPKTSKRIRVRLGLSLPVRVHCRESTDSEWVEITRLIDVTPFGAGSISQKGASLFTSLIIAAGRFVRLTSQQYSLTVFAAVRSSSKGADGVGRIHVEFTDREWPL